MINETPDTIARMTFWQTRAGLIVLLAVAATLSAMSFAFQHFQGPSLVWRVDGDEAVVAVKRFPFEEATRAYQTRKISGIDSVEMPERPGTFAIVYNFSGLNLRSPWQNSHDINRYDEYYAALGEFFRQVRQGNLQAELRHYSRSYPLALASMIGAVASWLLFFFMALSPRTHEFSTARFKTI